MKTDRELLERAAKAIGNGAVWHSGLGMGIERETHSFPELWNPLEDDGDALRLAVKLCIDVNHGGNIVVAEQAKPHDTGCAEGYGLDPYAATRRAIVLAAAAIGEAM